MSVVRVLVTIRMALRLCCCWLLFRLHHHHQCLTCCCYTASSKASWGASSSSVLMLHIARKRRLSPSSKNDEHQSGGGRRQWRQLSLAYFQRALYSTQCDVFQHLKYAARHSTAQHSTARSDSSSPIPLRACISLDLFPTCTVQQHRANTVTCLLVRCIRLRVHLSVRVLSVHGHPPFCLQTALAFVLQHFFLFFVFGWMKIFHHCSVNSRTRASTWMHETAAAPPTHSVVVVLFRSLDTDHLRSNRSMMHVDRRDSRYCILLLLLPFLDLILFRMH